MSLSMITIYTTGPECGFCNTLKAAFQKAGIAYEEKPLDAAIISECLTDTGIWVKSAPLVKDGAVWFFASDFFDAHGNLKPSWLVELKGVRPHKEFTGSGGQPSSKVQACKGIWGE